MLKHLLPNRRVKYDPERDLMRVWFFRHSQDINRDAKAGNRRAKEVIERFKVWSKTDSDEDFRRYVAAAERYRDG